MIESVCMCVCVHTTKTDPYISTLCFCKALWIDGTAQKGVMWVFLTRIRPKTARTWNAVNLYWEHLWYLEWEFMEIQRKLLHFLAIRCHRKDGRNSPLLQATEARRVCMQCKLCTWIQSLSKNNRYLVTRKTLSAAPVSTSCKILKWILRINGKQLKHIFGQSMCSWRWYREGQCMNRMRHIYFFINYINCILWDPWDDEWRNKSK